MASQHAAAAPPAPLCEECGVPARGGLFKGATSDAVCPVCEMGVKLASSTPFIQYRGGQTLLFCCHACLETFEANNRDYIEKHDAAAAK